MRQRLNAVSMKQEDDPAVLFEQIAAIENRYNTVTQKLLEEDAIGVVMSAAHKDYMSVITSEQRLKKDALTLTDLEEVMSQQWRQTKGRDDGHNNEIALTAFEGVCITAIKQGIGQTNVLTK